MNFKEMRPFQIAVMAVFGIVAAVGLYVFATFSGPDAGGKNIGSVEIWGTLPEDAVAGAIDALAAADKSYRGVRYSFVRPESFSADLANALASGAGPDLVIITQEQLAAELPKLEPISYESFSERTFRDAYASIAELFLFGNGIYGIPVAIDPLVLYYNRPALASAGIAQPPATWEAVAGTVQATARRGEAGMVTRATVPFGGYPNVTNARAILSTLFLQAGSRIVENGRDGLRSALLRTSSGASGNPLMSALTFYTQFADPVKSLYTWSPALPASRQMFLSGDLVLYPGYASEARSLRAANPNLDFDMAPLPQPAAATDRSVYGLAYAFAITRVSDNKAGAFSAALALASSDFAPYIAARAGMAPARRASLAAPPDDLYSPVIYPQGLIARGWLSPRPDMVDGIFAGMILNVTSGRTGVGEALSGASQAIDAALR